jgi:hypothetical protein
MCTGIPYAQKIIFRVLEQYLFAYGDLYMGICTHFAHEKFAYGDPHMQKCLKKHISDGLFLHNEVVRIWGLYTIKKPTLLVIINPKTSR